MLRFRDPPRKIPQDAGLLVALIDGRIVHLRREQATHRRPSPATANDEVIKDLGGGPWTEARARPLRNRAALRQVNDERDDDVWCLRFVASLDLRCTAPPWPGRSWRGTAVRRTVGRNACAGSSNPLSDG